MPTPPPDEDGQDQAGRGRGGRGRGGRGGRGAPSLAAPENAAAPGTYIVKVSIDGKELIKPVKIEADDLR
jgi:hypothetical protein